MVYENVPNMNGLLNGLSVLTEMESRSISAENPTGEKGNGAMSEPQGPDHPSRQLGKGWKCRPSVQIRPGETLVVASIDGPALIQSIWMTGRRIVSRHFILRVYWDNQEHPSIECPIPDFFASPWACQDSNDPKKGPFYPVRSIPIVVNPTWGLNSYWPMPFKKHCRITIENISSSEVGTCFYQVNYCLKKIPENTAYFHAQFRRTNPLRYGDVYTIIDDVKGDGQYVGTVMGWDIKNNNWWGEGEIKFYLDGDIDNPTICGTGTEDYFGGAYDWVVDGSYVPYTTSFQGMHQVLTSDNLFSVHQRHGMYRWHLLDPIRFKKDIRVTIQALGWRDKNHDRFLPGMHDICSVAYWYQTLPTVPFPELPNKDALEII